MEPKFRVWLEERGKYIIGEKEARILEGIRRYGSIMSAAKSLGVTYAHAWNLMEGLAWRVGAPIVSARRGGGSGGGSELTGTGEELLSKYLELEEGVAAHLGKPRNRVFPEVKGADLVIAGSSCVGVKILARLIEGISIEVVEVGSAAGIMAVMLAEADIAGIHLYDEFSNTYNTPFLRRLWPPGTAFLIKGYVREQGFIVRKGNPRGLCSLKDIVEKGATLVNRNLGSGTRNLLERLIRQDGILAADIKGYDHEVRTHEDVAKAIGEGSADVGIGLRAIAELQGLDFLKICEEEFDFVCESRRAQKREVQRLIATLKSAEFKNSLGAVPGLYCTNSTGDLVEIRG